jgi:hypothetical protein
MNVMLTCLVVAAISAAFAAAGLAAEPTPGSVTPSKQRASPSATEESTRNTLPASQHELWERVLRLISEDKGFTPKARVEAVLGVRFTHAEKDGELQNLGAANFYSMKLETPELGSFHVGLFDDPKKTGLVIGWGQEYAETRHCLSLKETTKNLQALGWVSPMPRSNQPGRGVLHLVRPEETAKNKERGVAFNTSTGDSELYLKSPNQVSDCVNGFATTVWRNLRF